MVSIFVDDDFCQKVWASQSLFNGLIRNGSGYNRSMAASAGIFLAFVIQDNVFLNEGLQLLALFEPNER